MTDDKTRAREQAIRRELSKHGARLEKTPSRHWSKTHYGVGYQVVDDRNVVRLGASQRPYDATLDEVEQFVFEQLPTQHAEIVREENLLIRAWMSASPAERLELLRHPDIVARIEERGLEIKHDHPGLKDK
jgi:hypothetical protein